MKKNKIQDQKRRTLMFSCTDDEYAEFLDLLRVFTTQVKNMAWRNPRDRFLILREALQQRIDEYNSRN